MLKSMTGFGRAKQVADGKSITVEIKSINHRYFEMYARIPRSYMQLEDYIRAHLQKKLVRGKIEVNVSIAQDTETTDKKVCINKPLLKDYLDQIRAVSGEFGLEDDLRVSSVLRFPEVVTFDQNDEDVSVIWEYVRPVVDAAVDDLVAQRTAEGERLKKDITEKCLFIREKTDFIKERSPYLVDEYIKKLRERIELLLGDTKVDEQRLLTETAIMADKLAVDEEIVRLYSHCESFLGMLETEEAVGKKLDFLIQEMNREVNTISSKIGDIEITKTVIELKNCIEKIREQIQNIE